jgi:RNA polymerase-binding transcription factor
VDLAVARARLDEMKAELDRSIATLTGEGDLPVSSPDDRSSDPGAALADNDREEAVIEAATNQRDQVLAALRRVEDGTYGRCVDCGAELPDERLEARPEAARCVSCQARSEHR